MKFKIKEGYPKMSIIHKHKKYVLAELRELPDEVYKFAGGAKNKYGIIKITEEKKDGKHNSRSE